MSLSTSSAPPVAIGHVVPQQPAETLSVRPLIVSIPTSERLSDAAVIRPLVKRISGKIRKGRKSIFKEVGLENDDDDNDDGAPGTQPVSPGSADGNTTEREHIYGYTTDLVSQPWPESQQRPESHHSSGLGLGRESQPRKRLNSLPTQWYTRLTRLRGRPRVKSASGATPQTISGFHQMALAAMLIAFFLPTYGVHNRPSTMDAIGADAGVLSTKSMSPTTVCTRWAHQSANVNGTLYLYGGEATMEEGQENDTWNNNFLTLDLNTDWSVDSPAMTALEKPDGPPPVALGYLWQDYANIYLYGGQFSDDPYVKPGPESLWKYSIKEKKWIEFPNPETSAGNFSEDSGQPVHRASEGAGISVPELGLSWYFGGHLDWATTPGWSRDVDRVYLKSLLEFTHPGYMNSGVESLSSGSGAADGGVFRNITSGGVQADKFPERADGALVFIPGWGELGVLIGLAGGTADTFTHDLGTLDVYDIASSKWFHQQTSGDTPGVRVNPCAVVASAPDASSFQVFLFGGQNLQPYENQTQYNDMFILTIPAFTWIKIPSSQNTPSPRAGHTCAMRDGQLIVVGGYVGDNKPCDSPGVFVFDASELKWQDQFKAGDHKPDLNADNMVLAASYGYTVPEPVYDEIGGDGEGGATVTTPASGPASDGPFATGKPPVFTVTQASGTATVTPSSDEDDDEISPGLIGASVIAGVAGILAFYLGFCAWLYRRQLSAYRQHLSDAKRYSDSTPTAPKYNPPEEIAYAERQDHTSSDETFGWEGSENEPAWLSEPKWVPGASVPGTSGSGSGSGSGHPKFSSDSGDRRYSGSGESTEGLLDGQEPSFFNVVIGPRRALRVVNGLDS